MTSRSSRISGSPPERPSCTAPSARASRSTRSQSSVVELLAVCGEVDRVVAEARNAADSDRSAPSSSHSGGPGGASVASVGDRVHPHSSQLLLQRKGDERVHVGSTGRSAPKACSRSATIVASVRSPSQRFRISPALRIELHHAFGIEQHVRVLRRLPLQAEAAADRQALAVAMASLMSWLHSAAPWHRSSPTAHRA